MVNSTLGTNLDYLMKLQGDLSVSELARMTHVPQPTLHHILHGVTKKPRRQALEALAKFFSVSVAQLIGAAPLDLAIPNVIKESLKITTIPIIEWSALSKWPVKEHEVSESKKIFLDRKVDQNAFALVMKDSHMEPMFPEKSLLVFDYEKKLKDRDFVIVYLAHDGEIVFNRLFLDGKDYYIKCDKDDRCSQLIKLNFESDRIIGTLIELRLQF